MASSAPALSIIAKSRFDAAAIFSEAAKNYDAGKNDINTYESFETHIARVGYQHGLAVSPAPAREDQRQAETETWWPIETHDGSDTPVFAICGTAYTPTPFEAWFFDGAWRLYSQPEEKRSGGVTKWFPTHWMPKSALPAIGRAEGRA